MRTAEMLALFDEAESGIFTLQEKFIEFVDYFLDVTDYSGPSPKNKIRYGNAAGFVDMVFHPVTFSGVLYIYDAESGLFRPGMEEVRSFVQHKLSLFAGEAVCDRFFLLPPSLKLSRETDEVCRQVAALHVISGDRSPFNQFAGIPAANGVVVFEEGDTSLVPYRPEMMFTRKIPVAFHADADTSAAVSLLRSWAGDNYPVLVQIAAQAFLQAFPDCAPFKRAYIFCGSRNSGKSSCLEFFERFLGEEFVSHLSFQALSERFNECSLDGKFLNAGDDLSSAPLRDVSVFKRLTGKAWHDVEPKGRPRYNARLSAVHVFVCNELPGLSRETASDDAFWGRLVVLPFCGSFEVRSFWSSLSVPGVLEGFLRLVVQESQWILENGGQLRFAPAPDAVRAAWSGTKDPLPVFMRHFTRDDPEGEVPKDRVVRLVNLWGADHPEFSDAFPMSVSTVSRRLKKLGYTAKWKGSGDSKHPVYCGFSLKEGLFVTDERKVVCDEEGMHEYLRRSVRCEADEE